MRLALRWSLSREWGVGGPPEAGTGPWGGAWAGGARLGDEPTLWERK